MTKEQAIHKLKLMFIRYGGMHYHNPDWKVYLDFDSWVAAIE